MIQEARARVTVGIFADDARRRRYRRPHPRSPRRRRWPSSPRCRPTCAAAAILGADGEVLAASGEEPERWREDAAALLRRRRRRRGRAGRAGPRRHRAGRGLRAPPRRAWRRSRSPSASRSPRCCSSTCAQALRELALGWPAATSGAGLMPPKPHRDPARPRLRLRRRGRRLHAPPPHRPPAFARLYYADGRSADHAQRLEQRRRALRRRRPR